MSRARDLLAGAVCGALAVVTVRWWRAGREGSRPVDPPLPEELPPPPGEPPPLPVAHPLPAAVPLPLPGQPRHPTRRWGVEPEGVRAGWVWATGLALLLLVAATLVAMAGLSELYGPAWYSVDTPVPRRVPPPAPARASLEPPDPAIPGEPHWEDPAGDLRAWRAQQEERLHGYRWVDREAGVVAIPIERAIALRAAGASSGPAPERRQEGR